MIPLRSTERIYSKPAVTLTLIGINVAVFLYQLALGPYVDEFIRRFGIVPDHLHYSSLLTSMFLHGGWLHLLGNMWFLWIFGKSVEDSMGHEKFLGFYLVCGIIAAVAHVLFNFYSPVPTIGASGAIAGVMGAYLIMFPRARIVTLVLFFVFITTLDIPAAFLLLYWFAIQFFSGVGSIGYSQVSTGGVAWFAHVGGFLAGMLLAKLMGARPRYHRWYME
ncbi:MAG TPA: rhomboid family intramembrane serine protease [Bryobacteraceae bacterium]|nr:rhomboid family intramembrane serine protease [Bryobacteraceae bacterium]